MNPSEPSFIGRTVVDREGFEIGVIQDLITNDSTGEIQEYVLTPRQQYLNMHDISESDTLTVLKDEVHAIKHALILLDINKMTP